jgi:uncharacterized repeat protein (TIGR01451 family)
MFRKLVSNLPFSPALVGQLGFYARRLRKEETTRRAGLLVTVLALVMQSMTVFVPSSSANSSSTSDLIYGGVTSMAELLAVYDNPRADYKKIMDYNGITRAELAAATKKSINSRDYGTGTGQWLSWGRNPRLSAAQGEVKHDIDGTVVYSRPLWRLDTTEWTKVHGSTYSAFVGTSAKRGTFAIILDCANLVTRTVPAPVKITVCRPGVGVISIFDYQKLATDLPADSDQCKPKITVCRPGVGVISIFESEKRSTDLPADSEECKPKVPVATCKDIAEVKIDRTKRNFKAEATAVNGATINAYVFTVRKGSETGSVVKTVTVTTTATSAESGVIDLKDTGEYYVSVVVKTSLGERKSADCATKVTVVPPEVCEVNPNLLKNDPECKPCPANPELWAKSPECSEVTVSTKHAVNLTQNNVDATTITAVAGDRIEYTLTVTNPGKVPANASFVEKLDDVLEYATIQDNGGGSFNADSKVLSWPTVTLKPGEKQTRIFTVLLPATIPATARGTSDTTSYDCIMNNVFGDNIQIKVQCEAPKLVESAVTELPSTGPRENILFAGALLAVVVYFWARSRQLGKEVRLVRKDFSGSAI